jgi:hypothetical protein
MIGLLGSAGPDHPMAGTLCEEDHVRLPVASPALGEVKTLADRIRASESRRASAKAAKTR